MIVQHRIALGLEGVAVSELVGDFPTVGFVGADVEPGNANIAYWSADAFYNYQKVGSADDILPVWEGLYLSLQPGETYTLTYSGTMPAREVSMEVAAGSFLACSETPHMATTTWNNLTPKWAKTAWRCVAGTPTRFSGTSMWTVCPPMAWVQPCSRAWPASTPQQMPHKDRHSA